MTPPSGKASRRPPLVVRPATVADARAIAEIRVASWRATYAGMVPAGSLDRMDVDRNEAFIGGLIEAAPPRATLVVEDDDGRVAGYALAAPGRDDDAAGRIRLSPYHPG